MNIVKQNPFRILGVTSNTSAKDLQKQLSKIKAYLRIGREIKFKYDFAFLGNLKREINTIQEASNKIELPDKKFMYSLFWFVDNTKFDEIALNYLIDNNIQKAIEIWNKTLKDEINDKNFSSYQNLSSLYIALSITGDQIEIRKLRAGISLKLKLLHSEMLKDLSKLIINKKEIVNSLIIKKFVNEIIELLKIYKIPNEDLISLFTDSSTEIQKYVLTKSTKNIIANIENHIEKTSMNRKKHPIYANNYGEKLFNSTKNDIILLKKLLGESDLHYQILSDNIANELLQCSVDYFNNAQEINDFNSYLNTSIKLVKLAKSIAISKQVTNKVNKHLNTLYEIMRDWEVNQAILLLQSIRDFYEKNKLQIIKQIKIQENKLGPYKSINWGKVNQIIKKSVDWDKVIDLVLEKITPQTVAKIEQMHGTIKAKKYKSLVVFLFSKLGFFKMNKVKYLAYWRNKSILSKVLFNIKYLPTWIKGLILILVVGLIWGKDVLYSVVLCVCLFIWMFKNFIIKNFIIRY